MISRFRAAALAVVVVAFAGAALLGGPVQAWEGGAGVPVVSYLDHASAMPGAGSLGLDGDLGLNGDASAAPVEPLSLAALVEDNAGAETGDTQQDCLASAVYFEARGEPLPGQLAVAEVVMNRAASDLYPSTLCGVVVQPAQFSFVRRGHLPRADRSSEAWRRAVGVARVAVEGMAPRQVPPSCLWYHANYVSPSWGRRLAETRRIGLHIFYS